MYEGIDYTIDMKSTCLAKRITHLTFQNQAILPEQENWKIVTNHYRAIGGGKIMRCFGAEKNRARKFR
jgi:2',3'-cyclic-nucleotide 2'-phosphodiesterase/3'-nucleotidase